MTAPAAEIQEVDVVVVGGGPSGSTAAALMAMRRHRVRLLEKESFPRYQIGESLLPSTVHGVCRMLGLTDELAGAGFPIKRGGTLRWGSSPDLWSFFFSVSPKMAGRTSFAYQVERMKFDKILLDRARELGVDVRERCSVNEVVTGPDGRVRGVRYTAADGTVTEVHARYVVDASGHQSRIYRSVGGERQYSDFFRGLALFGYFEGGKRFPPPNTGNLLSAAFESGWFWYIPLTDTLTSVGAVVGRDMAHKIQGDPEAALHRLIQECPEVRDMLRDARRVTTGEYGRIRVRKDYSYHHTRFWCPGMVLVGDVACFVDPVFSSGVHLATYGALLAARSINSVLAGTVTERAAFDEFERRYRREYGVFYEFLISFYDAHVDKDSYFWAAKKVMKSTTSELQAFVELVGGVSSGEQGLGDPELMSGRLQERADEFASAIGELAHGDGDDMVPLFRSSVVRAAMREGAQVQTRALLGEASAEEVPLFEGGLVASPDGLLWTLPTRR